MSEGPDSQASNTAAFWAAVSRAPEGFVSDMMAGAGKTVTAEFEYVATLLQRVHPDLCLVVGRPSSVRPEIVISAGGIREAFPAVRAVVDAAPAEVRARYDVVAFRPRVPDPENLRIRVKGQGLGANDIHFDVRRHRADATRCDLIVHVPGYMDAFPADSLANRPVVEAVFLLLDHLVGEWAVEEQIGAIDWHSLTDATGLPTLVALPGYLDQRSTSAS